MPYDSTPPTTIPMTWCDGRAAVCECPDCTSGRERAARSIRYWPTDMLAELDQPIGFRLAAENDVEPTRDGAA